MRCPTCQGAGRAGVLPCSECGGSGWSHCCEGERPDNGINFSYSEPEVGTVIAVGHIRPRWMFVRRVGFSGDRMHRVFYGPLWSASRGRWARYESAFALVDTGGRPRVPKPSAPKRGVST